MDDTPEESLIRQYKIVSSPRQKQVGMSLVRKLDPKPGEHILDMGCGMGELSAFIVQHVGRDGSVLGVDPDKARIKDATAMYRELPNLKFKIGNSFEFPGEGEQIYDAVFASTVLNWISNKEEFFLKVYSSLKHGGRYLFQYPTGLGDLCADVLKYFGRKSCWQFDDMERVIEYAKKAGFIDVCLRREEISWYFDNIREFAAFLHASSNGLCDFNSISKERLDEYTPSGRQFQDGKIVMYLNWEVLSAWKKIKNTIYRVETE